MPIDCRRLCRACSPSGVEWRARFFPLCVYGLYRTSVFITGRRFFFFRPPIAALCDEWEQCCSFRRPMMSFDLFSELPAGAVGFRHSINQAIDYCHQTNPLLCVILATSTLGSPMTSPFRCWRALLLLELYRREDVRPKAIGRVSHSGSVYIYIPF